MLNGSHIATLPNLWTTAALVLLPLGCSSDPATSNDTAASTAGTGSVDTNGTSATTGETGATTTDTGTVSATGTGTTTLGANSAGTTTGGTGSTQGTATSSNTDSTNTGALTGSSTGTTTTSNGAGGSTASSSETTSTTTGGGGEFVTVPFILGADISFVQEEEDKGNVFVDGGVQKDFLQILTDHGFNYARLRLFHSPGNPNGYQFEFVTRSEPYCDLEHTIEMAQRVKAAGMGLLLDLHYSDTWADPSDQHKPAAWENLSFTELKTAVYDYTRDTLLAFQAAGALPEMVQVGNEITPGMLHPDGHTFDPDNWDQLAQLLSAGLSAVKEVDPRIQTILHLDRGGDNETTRWWVDEALERGVQFDILGESAYTAFHGTPSVWEENFADLLSYPNLKFIIAEYNGEKRAANDIMRNLPDGRGLGTFFWEPTASGEWGSAMFTWSGSTATANPSDFAIYDQLADDYGLR